MIYARFAPWAAPSPWRRAPNRRPELVMAQRSDHAPRPTPRAMGWLAVGLVLAVPRITIAAPCPAAADLPLLTIDEVRDSAVAVTDTWQVVWGSTPLSDAQLASLSGDAALIDLTQEEL